MEALRAVDLGAVHCHHHAALGHQYLLVTDGRPAEAF